MTYKEDGIGSLRALHIKCDSVDSQTRLRAKRHPLIVEYPKKRQTSISSQDWNKKSMKPEIMISKSVKRNSYTDC